MQKKQNIIRAAIHLFAAQGFDGTTTLQIAHEAQVTEPLIYYHFKGKDDLFTCIIESAFSEYFSALELLPADPGSQFEKLENLLNLHFQIIAERPDETFLIVSTCPAKLNDTDHICAGNMIQQKKVVEDYVSKALTEGVSTGEFEKIPVKETTVLIIAMINGLVRLRDLPAKDLPGVQKTAIEFMRRSLIRS